MWVGYYTSCDTLQKQYIFMGMGKVININDTRQMN